MRTTPDRPFFPYATLLLALPALLLFLAPRTADILQYDRTALEQGQVWRLFTQHWLHWNADHLGWDLLAFIGLGCVCEQRNRTLFLATVCVSAVVISPVLWLFLPSLNLCRGLSGLDSALFALLTISLLLNAHTHGNHRLRYACLMAGTLFLAKTIFETRAGRTFFVDSQQAGMIPVPLCHLTGFIVGALLATLPFFTILSDLNMKKYMRSLILTVLRIVIGLGIAIFLIRTTMEEANLTPAILWRNLCRAHTGLLVLAGVLHGVALALGAWRWQLLLNAQNIHATWWNAFKLTLIGFFFNLAVPGAVGGDFAKMGYLAKLRKGQATEGAFSILVDRIFGILGLFFIAAVCVVISLPSLRSLPETALIRNAALLVGMGSIAGILGLLALEFHDTLLNLPGLRTCWPRLNRYSPHKLTAIVLRLMAALDIYRKKKTTLCLVLLISIGVHSALALDLFVIGKAMGENHVPLREYFLTTQVSNAVASVPLTPGGVGLRDKMTQESFTAFGMDPDAAALIPITLTCVILFWAMIGLLTFITGPGRHKKVAEAESVLNGHSSVAGHSTRLRPGGFRLHCIPPRLDAGLRH